MRLDAADWDIEIAEAHHRRKVDAPSGTALMLGEAAASGRGADLEDLRAAPYDGVGAEREAGKIGFSTSRAGGIVGEHTVLYLRQSGTRCRAYVLEGEAPPAVLLHHSRGGTYFKVWAASPAEAELEIEQAYQRRPELEQ